MSLAGRFLWASLGPSSTGDNHRPEFLREYLNMLEITPHLGLGCPLTGTRRG